MKFGEAIEMLKQGYLVTREGWNGKGMFLFYVESTDVRVIDVTANPCVSQGLKDYLKARLWETTEKITLLPYIGMKTADGKLLTGWLASQTDMVAEDWQIFK